MPEYAGMKKKFKRKRKQNNFEVVFFDVWQFKYKSFMSYIWLKKKIHDAEFSFSIISVWIDGTEMEKMERDKETDSILWPFIRI